MVMPVLSDELRERIRAEFPKYPNKQAVTLPALHIVQDAQSRRCTPAAMIEIAELLELHPAEVYDTMTFYGFFQEEGHRAGEASRVGLPEHLLHAARRRGAAGQAVRSAGVKPGHNSADGKCHARVRRVLGSVRRGAVHAGGR